MCDATWEFIYYCTLNGKVAGGNRVKAVRSQKSETDSPLEKCAVTHQDIGSTWVYICT